MYVGANPDVQAHSPLSWEDFISSVLSGPTFEFEDASFGDGFTCAPTAVTAVNRALIARAFSNGLNGLVIAVSDYQKEALAYCLNNAILSTKSAGENRRDVLPSNIRQNDVLCFGDVVLKFQEITPDPIYGDRAWFIYNGERASLPVSKLPALHRCASQEMPPKARGGLGLGTMATKHCACDLTERTMLDGCSSISAAIGLAIPSSRVPNTTPTHLSDGYFIISGKTLKIKHVLPSAHFTGNTELKSDYGHPADITPALVLSSRDTYNAGRGKLTDYLNYLDEGGVLSAVVVELDSASLIDDGYINDINDIMKGHRVPVIIFCDLVTASSSVFRDELHLPVFCWNTAELDSVHNILKDVSSPLSLSAQQLNYLQQSGSVMMGYTEPPEGVNEAAQGIFTLVDDCSDLPDREQRALVDLLRLFGQMLRRTCICSKSVAREVALQLEEIEGRLCGESSSKTLSPTQEHTVHFVCRLLRRLTTRGAILPKQEKIWERVVALEGEPLYLVVSNAGSRDEERRYWNHALEYDGKPSDSLIVLNVHEFMRTDLSEANSYTILSGWFNREEIGRILMSGNSKYYYSLLYMGSNLESTWRLGAEKGWKKAERRASELNAAMLERLNVLRRIVPEGKQEDERHEHAESRLDSLVDLCDAMRVASGNIDSSVNRGGEGTVARPVYFTNGDTCWLECTDSHHARLITVTDCLSEDGSPVRKSADLLEPGDVVLKIDNDDDLVSDIESHSNKYAEIFARARAWHKPIEEAYLANRVLPGQAIHLIQSGGCKRGAQTIRKWISDDTCIAPEDDDDIRIIGRVFGAPFSDEEIRKIRVAEKYCLGRRIHRGRTMTNKSVKLFAEEARHANSFEDAETEFSRKYGDQGELKVYYVDWVGDERVTTCRLGWHTS